jgi:hypothetical protein
MPGVEALVSSDTTQRLATPSAGATKWVKPRVSHQPRGSRYGKRIPGYSHPPNCNEQIRIWFRKSSWRPYWMQPQDWAAGANLSAPNLDLQAVPCSHRADQFANSPLRKPLCDRWREPCLTVQAILKVRMLGEQMLNKNFRIEK